MATQRVPALQFPSQPSPKIVERVTQDRLAEIITLRQQIEELEKQLGADYAKRVLASTKPDKYVHLVVTA